MILLLPLLFPSSHIRHHHVFLIVHLAVFSFWLLSCHLFQRLLRNVVPKITWKSVIAWSWCVLSICDIPATRKSVKFSRYAVLYFTDCVFSVWWYVCLWRVIITWAWYSVLCCLTSVIQLAEVPDSAAFVLRKEIIASLIDGKSDRIFSRTWNFHFFLVFSVQFSTEAKTSFVKSRF